MVVAILYAYTPATNIFLSSPTETHGEYFLHLSLDHVQNTCSRELESHWSCKNLVVSGGDQPPLKTVPGVGTGS